MSDNEMVTASDTPSEDGRESTAKFDRDELVRGWHAYEARKPGVVPVLKFAAKTDMGQVRENNEDKFDFYEPEDPAILAARGCLYAVADGIGGAQAGQIASEMLLKHLISGYYDHSSPDLVTALYESITQANDRIHALAQMIPERNGMGATLTALVFCENRVIVAQVGDSRGYCLRNGILFQITQDHSWVEEQVRAGTLSREDAENSPFRNVITRSVGASPTVQPDFYEEEIQVGDIWVLCSDGLTAYVKEDEIAQIVKANPPSESARQFIELANARGGRDNITVFVLAVRDLCAYADAAAHTETGSASAAEADAASMPAFQAGAPTARESVSAAYTESPGKQARHAGSGWRKLFGREA